MNHFITMQKYFFKNKLKIVINKIRIPLHKKPNGIQSIRFKTDKVKNNGV